jgi:hypothetical protein
MSAAHTFRVVLTLDGAVIMQRNVRALNERDAIDDSIELITENDQLVSQFSYDDLGRIKAAAELLEDRDLDGEIEPETDVDAFYTRSEMQS